MKVDSNKGILRNLKGRHYIINLQKNRSLVALISCCVSLFLTICCINYGLVQYAREGVKPLDLFQYFTITANAITAFATAMIIPYAIDGFRKKRFYCPKWAVLFYFTGTVCTTLIMVFATCVISIYDFEMAFRGTNFYLHSICPILILVSFFLIESYYNISKKEVLMSMIPVLLYAMVYIYKVIILGVDNGGWKDIYYFTTFAPPLFSFILMMTMTYLVALLVRFVYNKLSNFRIKKLSDNLWNEDVDDVEIKIELFGLGRYMGKKENKTYATLPLDIITIISDKYHIKKEELIATFSKGLIDSIYIDG